MGSAAPAGDTVELPVLVRWEWLRVGPRAAPETTRARVALVGPVVEQAPDLITGVLGDVMLRMRNEMGVEAR